MSKIDFGGGLSGEYDSRTEALIPGCQLMYELAQRLLESELGARAQVLVAGMGTGREVVSFANDNPQWSFVGFDPEAAMLKVAREKFAVNHIAQRVRVVQGLVADVKERGFDAATSVLVMHFLPDDGAKLAFLHGLADRLKPGGKLLLIDLEGDPQTDEFALLSAAWKHQQVCARKGDPEVVEKEFKLRARAVQFIPRERTEALLSQAGFADVRQFYKAYLFTGYLAVRK